MRTIRRADECGVARVVWLDSRHPFSFGHYHDPRYVGFGPLRVINEDRAQPARGNVLVNDQALYAGDGLAIDGAATPAIRGSDNEAEILLFDRTR